MELYKKIVPSRKIRLAVLHALSFIPDKPMIKTIYRIKTGHRLNLKNPTRYTEKLQWYKLYYHDPLMTKCVDKYDVRDYIASIGHPEILNDVLGCYTDPSEIDFLSLPDKFVLKDTLGSGGNAVIICTDKSAFDFESAKKKMEKWVQTNHRIKNGSREWPYYTGEKHRILIEKYIESNENEGGLVDYKFFCFQGRAEYMYGINDRVVGQIAGFGIFDRDLNLLPYSRVGENKLKRAIIKPENFDDMREIAEKISSPFPHARIDMYNQNGKIIFGEITFYSGGGFIRYDPDDFDYKIGGKFILPPKREE